MRAADRALDAARSIQWSRNRVLRDVQNFSYEEIADILQVSLGTVKSRILRGREALRRELTQRPDQGLAEAMA